MSELRSQVVEDFDSLCKESQTLLFITIDSEIQKEALIELSHTLSDLRRIKQQAVLAADEDFANLLLGFEFVINSLQAELTMWIMLKDGKPDDAWNKLVAAQSAAKNAVKVHESLSQLEMHNARLHDIEKLIFPPQVFFSVGGTVYNQICSICLIRYEDCDHLVGKTYSGELCCVILKDFEPDHVSLVDTPANKECRVTHVSDDSGKRNRMTRRIEGGDPGDDAGRRSQGSKPLRSLGSRLRVLSRQ
jgi:hypothetical protein